MSARTRIFPTFRFLRFAHEFDFSYINIGFSKGFENLMAPPPQILTTLKIETGS